MEDIIVKVRNGKLVKSSNLGKHSYVFQWDGVYYIHYGGAKMYTYEGKTYNCFPIITITENLKLVSIELFGCEGVDADTFMDDGFLWELPMDYDLWSELKPFKTIKLHGYGNA